MLKALLRDRLLLLLLLISLMIKWFSLSQGRVETWYTYGFYPYFSQVLRFLLGWIPFSLGDVLYFAAFLFLVVKVYRLLRRVARRRQAPFSLLPLLRKYVRLVLWIYIIFNVSWGLNYNRQGIAHQLGLRVETYDAGELLRLTEALSRRLNGYAAAVDTAAREAFNKPPRLFSQAIADYGRAAAKYPFLRYRNPSLKPSLYAPVGHLFGFTGYINPFTGEGQINGQSLVFEKPFVINHEIAHQLGYGKEMEASLVSYLVTRESAAVDFRYSLYYELFFTALYELRRSVLSDSVKNISLGMHPRVRRDRQAELEYRLRRRNVVEPYVSDFYDNYLKLNNQPGGVATYNEVIAWLIAYMRKHGPAAI